MAVELAPEHSYPFGFCDVCVDWNLWGNDRRIHGTRSVLCEYGLLCAISCCINRQIVSRNDRIGTVSLQYDSVCESIRPFCWWIFCHINHTGISSHRNELSDGFEENFWLPNIFRKRHIYNVAHDHNPIVRDFPNIFYPNMIRLERETWVKHACLETTATGTWQSTLLTTFDANEILPLFASFMISPIMSLHCLDVSKRFNAHLAR